MKNIFKGVMMLLIAHQSIAQEDSVVVKEFVILKYFNVSNSQQYLLLENKQKTGKKIDPLTNKTFHVYLDSVGAANKIADMTTDDKGFSKSFLPVGLKDVWAAKPVHRFLAVADGKEDEVAAEFEIGKAKISIDTATDGAAQSIMVNVSKYENDEWLPAPDVEMKVGIQRLGGILSAGDEETYTTDSSGTVTVELTKDSLPGDNDGHIILVAKVEDNELYGNLMVEKSVPWGISGKQEENFFDQRKLWATKFRTPVWLLIMAYSIVLGVWGTIIYLVVQIIKIRRIGISTDK